MTTIAAPPIIILLYNECLYNICLKWKNEHSQPSSFVFWKKLKHAFSLTRQTVTRYAQKSRQQTNNFFHAANMVRNRRFPRWCSAQKLVNPPKIIVHEINRNQVFVIPNSN